MDLTAAPIVKPDAANFIFGQSPFIKTVEDIHEALVGAVRGIRFGSAFCGGMTPPPLPSHAPTPWPSVPATPS